MNPSQQIIPLRLDPKMEPCLDGVTQPRQSTALISAAVSNVLDDNNLLGEILLRVCFPTTLVRAAVVCRRWLYNVSDPAFLRRFHKLHPPHLLGFYHNPMLRPRIPAFVPVLPQPLELAGVIHRASSSVRNYHIDGESTFIYDCRNGTVLIEHRKGGSESIAGVHSLLHPERGMTTVSVCQAPELPEGSSHTYYQTLSKEEGDNVSYLFVLMESTEDRRYKLHVFMLHVTGVTRHMLTIDQIPHPHQDPKPVLVGHKIYMPIAKSDIVVLDLTASSFSTMQLPQEVKYGQRNTIVSWADDAVGLYLIHVNQLQLRIWLHNRDGWLLVDTLSLHEMCASLSILDCSASVEIKQVGDNAEFVFLEMGRWTLILDIKRRTMHKVYEVTKDNPCLGDVYPFVMIWPPKFPALKDDLARNTM